MNSPSNTAPYLWLIAGPNGAGKSLFHKTRVPQGIPFINADLIARELSPQNSDPEVSLKAQEEAAKRRCAAIARKDSFCTETVFSHSSKLDLMREAKSEGYTIYFVFIGLENAMLCEKRVQQRVRQGGHSVASHKLAKRFTRSLDQLCEAVKIADVAFIYDNSSPRQPYRHVCTFQRGQRTYIAASVPAWLPQDITR